MHLMSRRSHAALKGSQVMFGNVHGKWQAFKTNAAALSVVPCPAHPVADQHTQAENECNTHARAGTQRAYTHPNARWVAWCGVLPSMCSAKGLYKPYSGRKSGQQVLCMCASAACTIHLCHTPNSPETVEDAAVSQLVRQHTVSARGYLVVPCPAHAVPCEGLFRHVVF